MTRWGLVSTIKAPRPDILAFAAWHLELGAHRLYLYLDEDDPDTLARLKAHPRIRARHTDAIYWSEKRPRKHQVRQCANARHANRRKADCDWLAHIDVDEFLLPSSPLDAQLSALPETALCARIRPVEALAPGGGTAPDETAFKALPDDPALRIPLAEACFPSWGAFLPGGFLSHLQGKLFFRTGQPDLDVRIHNVFLHGQENPGQTALPDLVLGHFHAADWAHFLAAYRFRLEQGSYRAELKPPRRSGGAPNLHSLFAGIEAESGETGLKRFFDEVCTATPDLCRRLDAQGLLRRERLPLAQLRSKHFPED